MMGSGGSTRAGEVVVAVDGCSHSGGGSWVRGAWSGRVMCGAADDEGNMGKGGNDAAVSRSVLERFEVAMGAMISQNLNDMFSISCSCTESSKSPSTSCSSSSRPSMVTINKQYCRGLLGAQGRGLRCLSHDAALQRHVVETTTVLRLVMPSTQRFSCTALGKLQLARP